jgi:hypothetical protein
MKLPNIDEVQTPDEARQIAIDWQNWQAEQNLSYQELWEYQVYFAKLAKKFHLELEFVENGII